MNDVASLLRLARKGRKFTLDTVAEWSGLSVSFLSEIERGVASPSLESLDKILRIYGCQLSIEEIPMTVAADATRPRKPILCLDFDGVLHSYTSGWKGAAIIPDPPVVGAIAFLYDAILSFNVQIYSSRSHQPGGVEAMQDWLSRCEGEWRTAQLSAGKPLMKTSLLLNIQFPIEKPAAHVTLDDRALTFTGTWPTIEALRAFKPWNK